MSLKLGKCDQSYHSHLQHNNVSWKFIVFFEFRKFKENLKI